MEQYVEPRAGLLADIIGRIHREERFLMRKKIILLSLAFLCSLFGFYAAITMMVADFSRSGFPHFLALAFSDMGIILQYKQSFLFAVLETLPALSLALFLAVTVVFLYSAKSLLKTAGFLIRRQTAVKTPLLD